MPCGVDEALWKRLPSGDHASIERGLASPHASQPPQPPEPRKNPAGRGTADVHRVQPTAANTFTAPAPRTPARPVAKPVTPAYLLALTRAGDITRVENPGVVAAAQKVGLASRAAVIEAYHVSQFTTPRLAGHGGGGLIHDAVHGLEHAGTQGLSALEQWTTIAARSVGRVIVRTARDTYQSDVLALREALRSGELAAREIYAHSDYVAAGLTVAGLVAAGVIAPEAVLPTLLFAGGDLFSGVSAGRAFTGGHYAAGAIDVASLGFSGGVADVELRAARSLDHLSGNLRSEYSAVSEAIMRDTGAPTTSAALRRELNRAIGAQRSARISSEQLRRAAATARIVSAILAAHAAVPPPPGWPR